MNFSEALEMLKLGHKTRRVAWAKRRGCETDEMCIELVSSSHRLVPVVIMISTSLGSRGPYGAGYADLLADDWEVVDGK